MLQGLKLENAQISVLRHKDELQSAFRVDSSDVLASCVGETVKERQEKKERSLVVHTNN